jgi:hypothetical protein
MAKRTARKRAPKSKPQKKPAELVRGEWRLSSEPRQTTLREHGAHTIINPQPFECRQLDIQYRAKLGQFVDPQRNPQLRGRSGLMMLHCLAHSITKLGAKDLTEVSIEEAIIELGRLSYVDVMYSTYLRLTMIDDGKLRVDLPEGARCRHCMGPVPKHADVDLYDLRVDVHDEAPTARYRLRYPWKLRGTLVEEVSVKSPDLHHGLGAQTDTEMANEFMSQANNLAAAIYQANGERVTVRYDDLIASDADLGHAMRDPDTEALFACLDELTGGPAQEVFWTHPPCKKQLAVPVSWGPAFFGRGAVSVPGFTSA